MKKIIVLLSVFFCGIRLLPADDSVFMRMGYFPGSNPKGQHFAAQIGLYDTGWHYAIGLRGFEVYEKGWDYRNYVSSAQQYSCPHADFDLYQKTKDSRFVIDLSIGKLVTPWLSLDAFISPGVVEGVYQRLERSNVTGWWYAPASSDSLGPTVDGGVGLTVKLDWFDVSVSYSYRAGFIVGAGYRITED